MCRCEESGRASFDLIAVLYAVRGPHGRFNLQPGDNYICDAANPAHASAPCDGR